MKLQLKSHKNDKKSKKRERGADSTPVTYDFNMSAVPYRQKQ